MGKNAYKELFHMLRDSDLLGEGPVPNVDRTTECGLREAIERGASMLPGLYLDSYVSPLLRNLEWVRARVTGATMETLAGAVYDHIVSYDDPVQDKFIKNRLKGFLAVISNLYRSFLEPEPSSLTHPPIPLTIHPPLATFRPKLDSNKHVLIPFTLPATEVERLCGGKVAVVSIPSNYRNHPVLCWGAIAHEVGGHDILHAFPGLLLELRRMVRSVFFKGSDPLDQVPESKEQFLGLLWQYWAEEAASDVAAVLNLGPSYGKGLAIFLATINERLPRRFDEINGVNSPKGQEPLLTVSWPPFWSKKYKNMFPFVDSHPTDILKLNVIIGAIECLPLEENIRRKYIGEIRECIEYSLNMQKKLTGTANQYLAVSGMFIFKPGKLLKVGNGNKIFKVTRQEMEAGAREVGRKIATTKFMALNNNTLQDLETWDMADEALANNIKNTLISSAKKNEELDPRKSYLGDDAQLLAGTLRALLEYPLPEYYQEINDWLGLALEASYSFDPIWSEGGWYPIAGGLSSNFLDEMNKEDNLSVTDSPQKQMAQHSLQVNPQYYWPGYYWGQFGYPYPVKYPFGN